MAAYIEHPKVYFGEGPRRVMAEDFRSIGELPIRGGWGYERDDAVIIDKNDPVVPSGLPFDGVSIEHVYVEKRIYEELIIFRPKESRYSGIRWKKIEQRLIRGDGGLVFDHLRFNVTAMPDADWLALKTIWEGPQGVESPTFDVAAHTARHEAAQVHYEAEYWFEISSFFGT